MMDKIKENMCRFCLQTSRNMKEVFTPEFKVYVEVVEEFTSAKITKENGFPSMICRKCCSTIKTLLTFKETCLKSEGLIKQKTENIVMSPKVKNEICDDIDIKFEFIREKENYEPLLEDENCTEEASDKLILVNDNEGMKVKSEKKRAVGKKPYKKKIVLAEKIVNEDKQVKEVTEVPKHLKDKNNIACHYCGKLYSKDNLQFHMNVHKGSRPYSCEFEGCYTRFTSDYLKKRHFKRCHTDYAPYTCDVCNRKFKILSVLKIHKSSHFSLKLPCKKCGKLLRNYPTLRAHMITHTDKGYQCKVCLKILKTPYTWKKHQEIHTKE